MKAEWYYEGAENGGRVLARDARQTIIHEPPCSPFNEKGREDAKLISAAPELLQFAEAYIKQFCSYQIANTADAKHDVTGWLRDLAKAAITKATE